MGFMLNFSVSILILICTLNFVKTDFVSRRNLHQECNLISEIKRMDCGYGGIIRGKCFQQGCCFIPTLTKFIPWCFHLNQTYADPMVTTTITFRETTQVPVTSAIIKTPTVKPSTGKRIPLWLKNLLKSSEIERVTTTTMKPITTSEPVTQNSMTLVIEDELRCQNTYRLYKKIKGNEMCAVSPVNRIPCVNGKLQRKVEESECSACTRLKCCYDPIMKKSRGRILPHCFKSLDLFTTTPVTTTLAPNSQGQSSTLLNQNNARQPTGSIFGLPPSGQSTSNNLQNFLQYYKSNPQFQNLNSNNLAGAGTNQFGNILQNIQNGRTSNGLPMFSQSNSNPTLPKRYNPLTSLNRIPSGQGTSSNINSALSLLNRPQSSNTGSGTTNNMLNLLSLINKPKTSTTQSINGLSNPSSSTNMLLSLLQKPKTGSSSNMKDMLMSMYNPGNSQTSSSNTGSLSNILSLLSKPKTGSTAYSPPNSGQSSSGVSSIISSLYGNKAGSSTSLSNIQNLLSLMKRPKPVADFENKALPSTTSPNTASNSIFNLLSALKSSKTGNSPQSTLLSSLGQTSISSGSTTSALSDYLLNKYLPSKTASQSNSTSSVYKNLFSSLFSNKRPSSVNNIIKATKKPAVKPKVTSPVPHKPEIGAGIIPILYENETRALPDKTCYPRNCGHRATDKQITARIVGGQWTGGIAFWPWMASLRRTFYDDDRYSHICGATLISRRWILTAGHCFVSYEKRGVKLVGKKEKFPSVYAVHLGKYYRDSAEISMQVYEIESFEAHPDYDYKELKNDIAVARLKEPVRYTNYVQPACLPAQADPLIPGEISWVTGWGETLRVGDQNKSKLKELFLPLISSEKCKQSWPNHFDQAWICTEGAFQEDACAGDSGGPLVKRGKDKRWDLVGIAIAGTRTCSTDRNDIKPGIYTKVAYYRDFIDVATFGACNEDSKIF